MDTDLLHASMPLCRLLGMRVVSAAPELVQLDRPPARTVPPACMGAAKVYSTPSATGVQRMARGTVTNGLRASLATVPALSNPTYEVIASSRANPSAECDSVTAGFGGS